MAMWPLRVYTRKKRGGQRLSMTPTPDLGLSATVEAPAGPGRRLAGHCKPRWSGLGAGPGWAKQVEARGAGPWSQGLRSPGLHGFCPETCLPPSGWKGNDKAHGLRKIVEKAEQSVPGGSSSGPLRCVVTIDSPVPSALLKIAILIFC